MQTSPRSRRTWDTAITATGTSRAAVASGVGSNGEPARCQTPATTPTHRGSDRESVAAHTPIPSTSSRPSADSEGAESQNAASSWLPGKGSSACDACCPNHRSAAAIGFDPRDAANNRRSSLRRFVRFQTTVQQRSPQGQVGWCGAVSDSGRGTSWEEYERDSQFVIQNLNRIQIPFRFHRADDPAGLHRLPRGRFFKRKRSDRNDRSVCKEITDPRRVNTAATFGCRVASRLRAVCHRLRHWLH